MAGISGDILWELAADAPADARPAVPVLRAPLDASGPGRRERMLYM